MSIKGVCNFRSLVILDLSAHCMASALIRVTFFLGQYLYLQLRAPSSKLLNDILHYTTSLYLHTFTFGNLYSQTPACFPPFSSFSFLLSYTYGASLHASILRVLFSSFFLCRSKNKIASISLIGDTCAGKIRYGGCYSDNFERIPARNSNSIHCLNMNSWNLHAYINIYCMYDYAMIGLCMRWERPNPRKGRFTLSTYWTC